MQTATQEQPKLSRKDFQTENEVRWCPGCGDYAILANVQKTLAKLGVAKEKTVFISGIGCSSRFPYYMNTYGFHTIHGRAPTIATGLKLSRPDLSVWIITGDGDALAIGGNHFIHLLRRNADVKVLLFNNRIYGLTKGQYSPTSEMGKKAKSTPYGSIDRPFNPVQLALGANATFVARTIDSEAAHLEGILTRMQTHRGAAVVEILQNCVVFNDGAFAQITDKATKDENQVRLEAGKPMLFAKGKKAIAFEGWNSKVVDGTSPDLPVWSESAPSGAAYALADLTAPTAIGVFRAVEAPVLHELEHAQEDEVIEKKGKGDLAKLLTSGDTWKVGK